MGVLVPVGISAEVELYTGEPGRRLEMAGELRRAAAGLREPIVIIAADRVSDWQSVVRVMEAARAAGLQHITFTTQASR